MLDGIFCREWGTWSPSMSSLTAFLPSTGVWHLQSLYYKMRTSLERFLSKIQNLINDFDSLPLFQMSTRWIINYINEISIRNGLFFINILSCSSASAYYHHDADCHYDSDHSTIARRLGAVTTPTVTITLSSGPRKTLIMEMNIYLHKRDEKCYL